MADATNDFLEALHWRLRSLSLAGVTRVPRLFAASAPATVGAAPDAQAAPARRTPGGGAAVANLMRELKNHVDAIGAANGLARRDAPAAAPQPTAAAGSRGGAGTSASLGAAKKAAEGVDASLAPSRPVDPKTRKELDDLAATVAKCVRCKELARTRTQTVFSDGPPNADLMFIGEAPGEDEDRQGVPFVGRAGQLLTKIIDGGMRMRREDVYICNILKCRPPGNRNPLPEEAAACREYLEGQIERVAPKVICLLGGVASRFLLDDPTPVGRMRGRWLQYRGIPLRVTYHPAYLLRNYTADARKKVWDDVLEVVRKLKELRDQSGGPKQPPPELF